MPRYYRTITIQVDEVSEVAAEVLIIDFISGAFINLEHNDPNSLELINIDNSDSSVTLDEDQTDLRK